LLALVEPVEGVGGVIIGGELQLGVAWWLLSGRRGDEGRGQRGRGRVDSAAPRMWIAVAAEATEGGGAACVTGGSTVGWAGVRVKTDASTQEGRCAGDAGHLMVVMGTPWFADGAGGGGACGAGGVAVAVVERTRRPVARALPAETSAYWRSPW
jgi:hypothetical protein